MASIYNGQANILMIGCMLWSVCLLDERRWWLGAFALAVPVALKTYPIALAMILLVYQGRKLLLPFLVTLAGLYLLPFLFHPTGDVLFRYQEWLAFLVSGEQYARFEQVDFRTFLEKWGVTIAHADYIWVQAAMGLLVIVCLEGWRRCQQGDWSLYRSALLLSTFWMVCFGPATEEATYLLAGPAVAWVLLNVFDTERGFFSRETAPTLLRSWQTLFVLAAVIAGPLQTSILGEGIRRTVHANRLAPLGMLIFVLLYVVWQTCELQRAKRTELHSLESLGSAINPSLR